jgi:alcohol dehydrogenase
MRTCYGGPEQLHIGELPEPALMPDVVRIKVRAAGLNPVDFKTRDGKVKLLLPQETLNNCSRRHCERSSL